jgi:hypothetical protein
VRDQVADKNLKVQFISGKDQLANVLTKPLPSAKFVQMTFNLNVRMPTSSLGGHVRSDKSLSHDKDKSVKTSR